MTTHMPEKPSRDGHADFDYLIGTWSVRNRRLFERLKGSTQWEEFEATSVTRKVWDGEANLEEYHAERAGGTIQGLALRLYNTRTHQWSIYWANGGNGVLDTPMIGEFKAGRGEFYNREFYEERSIYVRFIWSDITPTSCKWEQAFSADGGKTWETNWIMEFARTA